MPWGIAAGIVPKMLFQKTGNFRVYLKTGNMTNSEGFFAC